MAARRERVQVTCRRAILVPCAPGLVGSQRSATVARVTLACAASLLESDNTNGKDALTWDGGKAFLELTPGGRCEQHRSSKPAPYRL
jgi:hypothetical protein